MNSFGLGIVLNFVDNATAGMNNVIVVFNNMMETVDSASRSTSNATDSLVAASYALGQVGDSLISAGSSIINMFGAVEKSVINTGMTMQGYRMQLSALYGSVDAGEAKLDEIKKYAMSSVFDIQSLIPAITTMKAVGIEAMSEVTTSSGQHTQKLLDYASDIAAMVPNMRNAYGTGVQAAMGALKEYIAEGNALSLKRGAGLDITGILGEDKGATIEERTQQIADLVEQLNIVGYTASLAGTPTQRLSNLEDALFNALSKIADSGVFDAYCNLLERASNWVFELVDNEENFNAVTSVLSDTLTIILSPLEKLLDIVMWIGNKLVDLSKNNPTLVKGILIFTAALGGLLVVGGALLKLLSTIGFAAAGLRNLVNIGKYIRMIGGLAGGLIPTILPFISLAFLLYQVWTHNVFGIRDAVTTVFRDLIEIIKICADAWDDNTLSEENFVRAKELGILPLIEAILDLKYKFGFFVEGFKEGFNEVFDYLSQFFTHLESTEGLVGRIAQSVGEFLKKLFGVKDTEQAWKDLGETIGKIAAVLAIVIPVVWVAVKAFGLIAGVASKIWAAVKLVANAFGLVWQAITWVVTGVASLLGISVGWAAAIVAAVVGIVALIIAYWDEICSFFANFPEWFMTNVLLPVGLFFLAALEAIVTGVTTAWNAVTSFISAIPGWIMDNIITPVVSFFTSLVQSVVSLFNSLVSGIQSIFSTVAGWVNNNVIMPIVNFFQGLLNSISNIFNSIVSAITGAFSSAYNTVVGVWNGIVDFFSGIVSKVAGFFSKISSYGSSISAAGASVPAAAEGVNNFVGGLIQVNEKGGELITLPSGSTVIPHDESLEDSFRKGMILGAKARDGESDNKTSVPITTTQNDYSVTFSAGSIVIQLSNASDRELEKAAEKLMKIIERKQKLKSMAVRSKEAVLV